MTLRAPAILAAALVLSPALAVPTAGAQDGPFAGAYLAAEHAARAGDVDAAADFYAKALVAMPGNAELLERTALHQLAAGRVEAAVASAHRLVEISPDNQIAFLLLASEAFKAEDAGRVLDLVAARGDAGGPFVGHLVEAWAHYASGEADTARTTLERLREDGTGGTAGELLASYHLGLLDSAVGDHAAAAAMFETTTEAAGRPTDRLVALQAGALARSGDVEGAIALIDARLARTLGDAGLSALRADLAEGQVPSPMVATGAEGAAEALHGISGFLTSGRNGIIGLAYARLATYLNPDLTEAKLLIGEMLARSGQPELAVAAYEAVGRDEPEALEARIGRARAIYEAGRVEPAIVAMREAIARFPRSVEAQTALGEMLRQEERWSEAAVAYDAAIDLTDPVEGRHWVLFYQRGIAHERAKQWPQAEADFLRALELEPEQPLVLNYLGYSWVEMRENLGRAQEMIERAVEQRPEDGYIVDSLGWVLFRLGDFEEATRHLERAVELKPVDPVINDHYGDALWMVGRRTEARFQWKRALSFEPEPEEAERIRAKLSRGLDAVLAEEAAAGEPAIISGETDVKKGG